MITNRPFGGVPVRAARLQSSNPRAVQRGQIPRIQRRFRTGTPNEGPHTFDPVRLQPSDYLDVARQITRRIIPPKERAGRKLVITYLTRYSSAMNQVTRSCTPFPPGTQGFLYYHPPTDPPPLDEGHLRFRITQSSDPATFSHGKDLLYPDGEPWNLPGGRIAVSGVYDAVRRMLLKDGLVTQAQLDKWGSRYSAGRKLSNVLDNLEAPFVINFALSNHTFAIPIAPDFHEKPRWVLTHPLTVREGNNLVSLCTGRAICRLEAATVRAKQKSGKAIVVRLLKVLNALEPSEDALERGMAFRPPKEDEIIRSPLSDLPWTIRIRKKALHVLWELASEKKETSARVGRVKRQSGRAADVGVGS